MSESIERIVRSERRFGRLEAYEAVLHWQSVVLTMAAPCYVAAGGPRWSYLVCFALACVTRAAWWKVIDAQTRQHMLVMAEDWEQLERLIGE